MFPRDFRPFNKSHFTLILVNACTFTPDSCNFTYFTANHANIKKLFTQNNEQSGILVFTAFTFHAHGEKQNHVPRSIHENFAHDPSLVCSTQPH